MLHYLLNMQRVLTCLLLAVTVRGTVASWQSGSEVRKDDFSSGLKMRVIGGETITNAELGGYIVAMYYIDTFACGGTLIHERILLSAAHCFVNRMDMPQWIFIGGISSLNDKGLRRKVKDVIISEYFRSGDLHSDVAVILLNAPMVGKNIGKVSLCSTELKPGMPLAVSGWGLTKEGSKQDIYLRTTTVPYIGMDTCRENYRNTEVNLTETMLCAGILGKKDACLYDSGGPLVYNKEICGIVSYGIGCAHKNYPGVYTDVKFVKPFIEESIAKLLKV